jgi:hypothetical protein
MLNHETNTVEVKFEGLHLCPICRKLYTQEKALFRHVVLAHADGEYLSYNLRAELYERWQERIPRCNQ